MGDTDAEHTRSDSDDEENLRASLANLSGLVSGHWGLEGLMEQIAKFAVHAIPGADGVGVTLLRTEESAGRVEALAASAPFVAEIDALQYDTLGEGPCITAVQELRTVRTGSLGGESMWPRFGPRVGRMGVHSALSLPLRLPGKVVGAINAYAREKDAFAQTSARFGEAFAEPAAVALHNAHVLAEALQLTQDLQTALARRPVIDQAVGVLRARSGASAEEALQRLREISQREHVKVVVVAQQIVDAAAARARAGREPSPETGSGH